MPSCQPATAARSVCCSRAQLLPLDVLLSLAHLSVARYPISGVYARLHCCMFYRLAEGSHLGRSTMRELLAQESMSVMWTDING